MPFLVYIQTIKPERLLSPETGTRKPPSRSDTGNANVKGRVDTPWRSQANDGSG